MARTGWASKEEWEYLTSLMPEYEACQVRRRYKPFWQRVNAEFLTKFPVMEKLFPGRKVTDLNPEEKEMYTAAVARQQQRLKEWFRWQLNPRSRNSGTVLSKKDLRNIYHGRTRVLKPYEAFAKLYPMEVEVEKKSRCAALGISGRDTLTIWHEAARDLYKAATPEQLEAIRNRMVNDREGVDSSSEEDHGREYSRYIRKLPSILDAAITPAVRKAGLLAFVTVVGPDPDQNGKITCKSFQFGDKEETPVFSRVWEGHDTVFVEELARFARRHEFPPEVCAARSANGVKTLNTLTQPNQDINDSSGKSPSSISTEVALEPQAPTTSSKPDAPAKPSMGSPTSPLSSVGSPLENAVIRPLPGYP
ncbi:hypothetical protein NMY22_g4449 [Coprinellus aureogranulatus]|nr:hypothetical protein NMY22_g4449 [Coprinellus aureogranulatus]